MPARMQAGRSSIQHDVPTRSDPCFCPLPTVFDNVRSNVPHMLLDDVFTAKEEIATSVKEELVRVHVPCIVWAVSLLVFTLLLSPHLLLRR